MEKTVGFEGVSGLLKELADAKSTAEVLQIYGKLDFLNVGDETLANWQQNCGIMAARTKGGEEVSAILFRMANETKNAMRTADRLTGLNSAMSAIARSLNER